MGRTPLAYFLSWVDPPIPGLTPSGRLFAGLPFCRTQNTDTVDNNPWKRMQEADTAPFFWLGLPFILRVLIVDTVVARLKQTLDACHPAKCRKQRSWMRHLSEQTLTNPKEIGKKARKGATQKAGGNGLQGCEKSAEKKTCERLCEGTLFILTASPRENCFLLLHPPISYFDTATKNPSGRRRGAATVEGPQIQGLRGSWKTCVPFEEMCKFQSWEGRTLASC